MTTSPSANWNYPTAIRFGAGKISELPKLCKNNGIMRPLLVTDPFLATQPMTLAVLDALQAVASDDALEAVTDPLLMAMHDLRSILIRKKSDRLMKDEAAE